MAIKSVPTTGLSAAAADNLYNEIALVQPLRHKNILRLLAHHVDKEAQAVYIVMELADAGDVSQLLRKAVADAAAAAAARPTSTVQPPLSQQQQQQKSTGWKLFGALPSGSSNSQPPDATHASPPPSSSPEQPHYPCLAPRTAQYYLRQLAEALRFLRNHHIAHLDLKPSNLMLCSRRGRLPVLKVGGGGGRSLQTKQQLDVHCVFAFPIRSATLALQSRLTMILFASRYAAVRSTSPLKCGASTMMRGVYVRMCLGCC